MLKEKKKEFLKEDQEKLKELNFVTKKIVEKENDLK